MPRIAKTLAMEPAVAVPTGVPERHGRHFEDGVFGEQGDESADVGGAAALLRYRTG
ncbi:hypothetical protein [Amycolatopsis alba]|uniref:hypothetical protein n=1 Tax=Amycolatopsis alba TaxID=76020 RepID=UPI0003A2F7C7